MKRATLTPEELKAVTEKFLRVGLTLKLKQELDHSLWLETGGEPIELDKDLVALAIDLASAKLSDRLATEFAREFSKQLRGIVEKDYRGKGAKKDRDVAGGDPNGKQQTSEAPPRTAEEVHDYLDGYCNKNLGGFNFSDKALADHAENVAKKAKAIKEDLELEDRHIDALAEIALYDIFFLCDDSGSMKIGKRIATLTKTLQSVADWATRLEPRGISIRFLNYKGDTDPCFDGLVDIPTIQDRIYKVKFGGGTMLGTMLDEKIINPFILRMERLENKRPLIAVIITDGEPTGEEEFCLKDTIISCKNHPQLVELGTGSILFILFRVGTSDEAKDFLGNLAADEDVKGMLYSAGDDIQEVRDAFERRLNVEAKTKENMYKKFLLEEFMNALRMQTD